MRDRRLRSFLKETRSATAVEFAMIGTVLVLFFLAIFMLGIGQFWQLVLDDSVRNATREFSIQAASSTTTAEANFVNDVCAEFGAAVTQCNATTIQYSVQGGTTFTGISPATFGASGLSNAATFSNVTAGNPLLVQVAYKVPVTIPLVPSSLFTLNGTPYLISASAIVVEP